MNKEIILVCSNDVLGWWVYNMGYYEDGFFHKWGTKYSHDQSTGDVTAGLAIEPVNSAIHEIDVMVSVTKGGRIYEKKVSVEQPRMYKRREIWSYSCGIYRYSFFTSEYSNTYHTTKQIFNENYNKYYSILFKEHNKILQQNEASKVRRRITQLVGY